MLLESSPSTSSCFSVTMASKAMLFMLAYSLLVISGVTSHNEELFVEAADAQVPAVTLADTPLKAPPIPVPVNAPPTPVPVMTPPPAPPVQPPTPATPVTPPTSAPLPPPRTTKECIPLCVERCKLHSRKNVCLRACLTCCDRCKCVPPGQYGNQEKCGKCYAEMTTIGGRLKCP